MATTTALAFDVCTDPAEFRTLITAWARLPEIWIDTETAEWRTTHSRISLLQVRTPDGRLHVIDVLAPGMREVLEAAFIPAVMADPAIRKWAHNAGYERRYLGGPQAQNLCCTVQLARSVPYHRLPVRSLTLKALCAHLFGADLDKRHQGDEWGMRPLSDEQLQYAAADPEWCHRVQQALGGLAVTFDPSDEDPTEIRGLYLDVGARCRERNARRGDIRDAVRDHMLGATLEALGGFRLQRRVTARTTIGELVRVAAELDPGHTLMFDTAVTKPMAAALDPSDRAAVRDACSVKTFQTFRGPRVPGREPKTIYPAATTNEAEIDRQYAEVDDARRRLDSERDELRCRLKAWMEWTNKTEWEGFRFAEPEERWSADMRALIELVPAAAEREVAVPARFRLAFGGGVLDRIVATSRETAFVTWRERLATHLDPEASQSRDWHEAAGEAQE